MGLTLPTNVRNTMCDAFVGMIDAGSGAGTIEMKSGASTVAGTNEVATLTFSDPAFGDASSGVATANSVTSDTNATGGTVGFFTIFDSNALAVVQGIVHTSTGDINLSSLVVGATDTVTISSLTFTQPAS
jgi:hypothetical protein